VPSTAKKLPRTTNHRPAITKPPEKKTAIFPFDSPGEDRCPMIKQARKKSGNVDGGEDTSIYGNGSLLAERACNKQAQQE